MKAYIAVTIWAGTMMALTALAGVYNHFEPWGWLLAIALIPTAFFVGIGVGAFFDIDGKRK